VEHTKKPIVSQFDILIEQGIITLDHLIKRKSTGSVVEKGPLFKIKPNALGLLFPPSQLFLSFKIGSHLFVNSENTLNRAVRVAHNVGSYTQGRIAGDFLSDRTRKSSGEPPNAAFAGS